MDTFTLTLSTYWDTKDPITRILSYVHVHNGPLYTNIIIKLGSRNSNIIFRLGQLLEKNNSDFNTLYTNIKSGN